MPNLGAVANAIGPWKKPLKPLQVAFMDEDAVSESVVTELVVSALTVDCTAKIKDPATAATIMTESKAKALVL